MKTVVRFVCSVVLVLFIFWPWLLRFIDLFWLVFFKRGFTYVYWWDAVWAGKDYWVWPFYAGPIVFISGLIWVGLENSQTADEQDADLAKPESPNKKVNADPARSATGGIVAKSHTPPIVERGWWRCTKCGVVFESYSNPPIGTEHKCSGAFSGDVKDTDHA